MDTAKGSLQLTRPPLLGEVDQIQGNILAGFNKDNQTLIFLKIHESKKFKLWLRAITPFVATTEEVLQFNASSN